MDEEKKKGFLAKVFEKPKDNEFATRRYILGNGLLLVLLATIMGVFGVMMIWPVSTEMDIDCTTGYVGLDAEANNYIENHSMVIDGEEYKIFNTTMLLDHININGIDDMRCKAKVKASGPSWLLLNGGW